MERHVFLNIQRKKKMSNLDKYRQEKRETVTQFYDNDISWQPIDTVIKYFQDLKGAYEGSNIQIASYTDEDGIVFEVILIRDETDEEVVQRMKEEKARMEASLNYIKRDVETTKKRLEEYDTELAGY